jgi:hypothetical protein
MCHRDVAKRNLKIIMMLAGGGEVQTILKSRRSSCERRTDGLSPPPSKTNDDSKIEIATHRDHHTDHISTFTLT